jgi:hypothetical protein
MITKEQFEELGLTVMPEFNGYDNKFYRNLAYKMYLDSLFYKEMLGYVHQDYSSIEEAIEHYKERAKKYWRGVTIEEGMSQQLNKDFCKELTHGHNEVRICLEDFDTMIDGRGWQVMYSTVNGYLVAYCLRSLKFQGYIKTVEDFKQLISWLRIDKFIR